MAGALEGSITLEDVFVMVATKKVPLAPELAGYLALEIAEGADEGGGAVDPRSVYVAEEGTVALVKPRRSANPEGDAEGSIRAILARLLEASGAKTPSLVAAARRRSTGSLRALTEELEAALIPVNRAAGRRALARLAREVKRVAMRVGRASGSMAALVPPSSQPPPPESGAPTKPPPPLVSQEPARPRSVSESFAAEAPTARRETPPALVQEAIPSAPGMARPVSIDLEEIEEVPSNSLSRPTTTSSRSSASDVDSLLDQFARGSERPDQLVARDLKAMAGLDPTPPPPQSESAEERPSDAGVEALLALSEPISQRHGDPGTSRAPYPPGPLPIPNPPPRANHPASQPPSTPAQAPMSKRAAAMRQPSDDSPRPTTQEPRDSGERPPRVSQAQIPTGADMRRQAVLSRISTGEFRRMGKRRSDLWLVAVLLGLIGIGAVIVWSLKPGFLTGRTPEKVAQEKAAAEAARQQAIANQQALACKVALQVTDVPANAEVLLRQGQAPVDVDRMPVGARLEFVATAEGFAPKRAVVPAGVSWDTGGAGSKPRYEVAVQLDKSSGKPKGDIWPPGEPGSTVGGQGPPGTVHIVTTPRGAEVWLLAGMGPDAHIEPGTPCDQDVDILIAGPTTFRKRIHVPASSFTAGPDAPADGRFAKVSAGGDDAGSPKHGK